MAGIRTRNPLKKDIIELTLKKRFLLKSIFNKFKE